MAGCWEQSANSVCTCIDFTLLNAFGLLFAGSRAGQHLSRFAWRYTEQATCQASYHCLFYTDQRRCWTLFQAAWQGKLAADETDASEVATGRAFVKERHKATPVWAHGFFVVQPCCLEINMHLKKCCAPYMFTNCARHSAHLCVNSTALYVLSSRFNDTVS